MSPLEQSLADYLATRRALGFKLDRAGKLLAQFVAYLHAQGADTVTTAHALAWVRLPAGASRRWWEIRMSVVRGFAAYLHTLDPHAEVPPPGLVPGGPCRARPYLYSDADIAALLTAAAGLPRRLGAATHQVLIGLLATTGLRIGEVIGLDRGDFDAAHGLLTARGGKFGKSRLIPLHPTTTAALRNYLRVRDQLFPDPPTPALLISTVGTRLNYNAVWGTFRRLAGQAGLTARAGSGPPRIHDLRHSFAVATLLDWYRAGADVQALLPRLSTYLGHTDPKHTYWYLTGTPELLALAADRLDTHLAGEP